MTCLYERTPRQAVHFIVAVRGGGGGWRSHPEQVNDGSDRQEAAPTEGQDAGRGGQERRTAAGKGKKRKAAARATTGGEVDGRREDSSGRPVRRQDGEGAGAGDQGEGGGGGRVGRAGAPSGRGGTLWGKVGPGEGEGRGIRGGRKRAGDGDTERNLNPLPNTVYHVLVSP